MLLLLVPGWMLLIAAVPATVASRHPMVMGWLIQAAALAGLLFTLSAAVTAAVGELAAPATQVVIGSDVGPVPLSLSVLFDSLTVTILALVSLLVAIIATATMTVGNFLALAQSNIKRMLAYSSIAHAGYILVGVAAGTPFGAVGAIFYLIIYLITNLAAFGIVLTFWRTTGSDEIKDYAGFSRRAPGLALAMMVAFLSLAGMPPFGGFIAKVIVFASAVEADMIWLAVVGVLNSIIGLYYYLIVLKHVYLYRSEKEDIPIPIMTPTKIALIVLTFGILLVGIAFGPWFAWSSTAASILF
jgi:NADH-quinone oxidoreductase subunit N